MSEYWKSMLGWWPVIYLAILGYVLPVCLIGLQLGLIAGIIALVVPIILFFDRFGALQLFALIAWLIYAAIAAVVVAGWWSLAVFLAWGVIAYVLIAGFVLFRS